MVGGPILFLMFTLSASGVRIENPTDNFPYSEFFHDIPEWLADIIGSGTLFTTKILGAIYTPKTLKSKGEKLVPIGGVREVSNGSSYTKPKNATLLYRFGREDGLGETVIQAWNVEEDPYIYFVGQRASGSKKYIEYSLVTPAWPELDLEDESARTIRIKHYEHQKGNKMWSEYGFYEKVKEIANEYPTKTLFFTGQSRGATMSEVLGLRCALAFRKENRDKAPENQYKLPIVVSTGAYRWTNDAGAKMMNEVLPDRFAHLLLSRKVGEGTAIEYDFVSRVPSRSVGFADMKPAFHIDKNTGLIEECVQSKGCPGPDYSFSEITGIINNYEKLHKSIEVIRALKLSMKIVSSALN